MVVDERAAQDKLADEPRDEGGEAEGLEYYLAVARGGLYAVPDAEQAALMPYIGRLAGVTPLPRGLVPPYVLGLVNVGHDGEVAVDLGAYLGLAGEPAPRERRRLLVIGERAGYRRGGDPEGAYRLAFAVDNGFGLTTARPHGDAPWDGLAQDSPAGDGAPGRATVGTRYGRATVLDMAAICADIMRALGAERPWGAPIAAHESLAGEE